MRATLPDAGAPVVPPTLPHAAPGLLLKALYLYGAPRWAPKLSRSRTQEKARPKPVLTDLSSKDKKPLVTYPESEKGVLPNRRLKSLSCFAYASEVSSCGDGG